MTRQELSETALKLIDTTKCLVLELITGYGKTKLSIDLSNHICDRVFERYNTPTRILILVSKVVHKTTWSNEINKWGGIKSDNIIIECYESLKKYKDQYFDIVILDEMQHLSPLRAEILKSLKVNEAIIGLSATINKDLRTYFRETYNAKILKCGLKEAIENDILPDPKVYLIPLKLDNKKMMSFERKGSKLYTTPQSYYNLLSTDIDIAKRRYLRSNNPRLKNVWLSLAGKRLKFLSEQKEDIVKELLIKFNNERTLVFCNNISQAERLGKYNITSKNKDSSKNLEDFNSGKIHHITACNILNESVNLVNCKIGIFCNLNSSEIITKQRCGRLLRHKEPIIIIPYFENTREEELMLKMIEEYNKDNITKLLWKAK